LPQPHSKKTPEKTPQKTTHKKTKKKKKKKKVVPGRATTPKQK
jgi:hypothetical protein